VSKPWHYASSGGLNYPVQPGDVWRAGPHVIACGDLEAGDGLRLIDRFGVPDVVYSDPPWNDGNAGAFRTKAAMPRKVDFTQFLRALLNVVRTARRDVFLEMGLAKTPLLMDLIAQHGGQVMRCWSITYYRRHPCALLHLRWQGESAVVDGLTGMDDDDTPAAALGACLRASDVVMDPCTGRGLTAFTVATAGRTFMGLELSPWRMSCTLTRLATLGYTINLEGQL
jgi:hypothetical protein